jgi:hypothetical protein
MDAPPESEALLAEDALTLLVAHEAAMAVVGAAFEEEEAQPPATTLVDAAAAATPGAAALRSLAASSLRAVQQLGDAARGRARMAPVCCRARAAADATPSSHVQRRAAHAQARACAAMYAELARDDAVLLAGAPALARLCDAAAAPPEWCFFAGGGDDATAQHENEGADDTAGGVPDELRGELASLASGNALHNDGAAAPAADSTAFADDDLARLSLRAAPSFVAPHTHDDGGSAAAAAAAAAAWRNLENAVRAAARTEERARAFVNDEGYSPLVFHVIGARCYVTLAQLIGATDEEVAAGEALRAS